MALNQTDTLPKFIKGGTMQTVIVEGHSPHPDMCQDTRKCDTGKPRYHLIMADFADQLDELAVIATIGAEKYTDRSWQKSTKPIAYLDACYRHLAAYNMGDIFDLETKQSHLLHAVWNLLALHWVENKGGMNEDHS